MGTSVSWSFRMSSALSFQGIVDSIQKGWWQIHSQCCHRNTKHYTHPSVSNRHSSLLIFQDVESIHDGTVEANRCLRMRMRILTRELDAFYTVEFGPSSREDGRTPLANSTAWLTTTARIVWLVAIRLVYHQNNCILPSVQSDTDM